MFTCRLRGKKCNRHPRMPMRSHQHLSGHGEEIRHLSDRTFSKAELSDCPIWIELVSQVHSNTQLKNLVRMDTVFG